MTARSRSKFLWNQAGIPEKFHYLVIVFPGFAPRWTTLKNGI